MRFCAAKATLGLSVVALSGSLLVGEAILRPFVTLPLPRVQPEVRYVAHPTRHFTLMPSQQAFTYGAPARIDERGFRTNGRSPYPDSSSLKVIALGDSFTFGLGVSDHETWPARVEQRLRSTHPSAINIINMGTISYGVSQEMDLLLENVLSIKPWLVIHGLYWNDFMEPEPAQPGGPAMLTADGLFVWDSPFRAESSLREIATSLVRRSALLFAFTQSMSRVFEASDDGYGTAYERMIDVGLTEEEWIPIEQFYRDMKELETEAGFRTLVVIMPVYDIVRGSDPGQHSFAVQARERLDASGIPYVDAFTLWKEHRLGTEKFLPQGADAHLNSSGYDWIAEVVATRVTQIFGVEPMRY